MKRILPILKNSEQYQIYKERNFYIEHLFTASKKTSPIVLYGEDNGEYIAYSPSVSKENDMKLKETALNNLKIIDVPFQIENINGNKFLYSQHEYAAEKILDKEFLIRISEALGSSTILVGIPIKGFLAASIKGKGDSDFFNSITNMFDNPQSYPISKSLFLIQNGEIEMMTVPKTEKNLSSYSLNGVFDDNDKIGFKVDIANDSEDGIANQIQEAYQSILAKIPENPKKYNGKINFHLTKNINLTDSLEKRIIKIANNISERGAVQIIGALLGEEFKIKFYYGDNKLISETIEKKTVQFKKDMKSSKEKRKWWKFW